MHFWLDKPLGTSLADRLDADVCHAEFRLVIYAFPLYIVFKMFLNYVWPLENDSLSNVIGTIHSCKVTFKICYDFCSFRCLAAFLLICSLIYQLKAKYIH